MYSKSWFSSKVRNKLTGEQRGSRGVLNFRLHVIFITSKLIGGKDVLMLFSSDEMLLFWLSLSLQDCSSKPSGMQSRQFDNITFRNSH